MMTHRERMLATIRGEATTRIPFAPRMDLWYIAQRARGTLAARFRGMNTVEIAQELGVACHAVGADYTLPEGRDVALRGLGIDNHPDYPYRVELRGLPVEFEQDAENVRTRIETPAGVITTHLYTSAEMKRAGISLPFVKSYAIESADDLEAMAQVFEHLEVIPTPQSYRTFQERVSEQGIAVARGPMAASPVHLILHELMPMDKFFYLYTDDREKMYALAQRMAPFFEAALEALAASPATVIFWGANYDQDLTWPPFFQREIMPWLQRVSDRFHAVDKYLLTHTDGENRALLPVYPESGFDVAESVCPAPMTLLTLAELREGMGPGITIWGGIPSVTLLPDSMDNAAFEAYVDDLFASLDRGDHLVLGVSDNVPPDASLDRLMYIETRATGFGPVRPEAAV